jgi:hypothetical protein
MKGPKILIAILLFLAGSITGCTKLCNAGYEGQHCNTPIRAKFEGTWKALDSPGNISYNVAISDGAGITGVTVSNNFASNYFTHNLNGIISEQTLTIPMQQPDSASHFVQGTGFLNGNTLNWSYLLINGADTTYYTGVWSK